MQIEILHSIPGLERAQMTRAGYAIEYDYYPPTQLDATLQVKSVHGLFFAGQINGTTGYEEAAGQGLVRQGPQSSGLTAQEVTIADLAARGLTNKQIGEKLALSPRTVSTHLSNIFLKLGVASRGELADFVREKGLSE